MYIHREGYSFLIEHRGKPRRMQQRGDWIENLFKDRQVRWVAERNTGRGSKRLVLNQTNTVGHKPKSVEYVSQTTSRGTDQGPAEIGISRAKQFLTSYGVVLSFWMICSCKWHGLVNIQYRNKRRLHRTKIENVSSCKVNILIGYKWLELNFVRL